MDNGLIVKSTNFSDLNYGDRVYLYGTADGDAYQSAVTKLQAGEQAVLTLQSIVTGGTFQTSSGVYNDPEDYETELENHVSSAISDLEWCGYGSFGNGYLNFTVTGDYYVVKKSGSNSTSLVPVDFTFVAKTIDAANKKVELVLVYDNNESQCVDAEGKLKDGYTKYSNSALPLSYELLDLYYELSSQGVADTDEIELSVYYVTNNSEAGDVKEVCSSSEALTGMYSGKNYFTLASLKKHY